MNYADNVEKSTTPSEFPSDAQLSNEDFIQVDWEDNDPDNPRNFTAFYKSWITLQMGMLALCGTLASSIIAPSGPTLSTYLDVSQEITVLTVSLYVLGFAFGPCLWAPLSEAYGRRWSILPAIFCLGILSIGTAVSKTLAGILITRFFGGIFGSAPISNVVAALGDLYAPRPRGIAVIFFAVCVVGGPTIGPVIGAALTINLGWRWTEYTMAIWTFTVWIVSTFCMPELYHPVLLERKARLLRKKTGSSRYRYLQKKITIKDVLSKHLGRPLVMFFTEPMVTAIALYASFVYGILYMTLEVFPIVFREQRGYSPVVSTLPFLGLFVGVCTAVFVNLWNQPRYSRIVAENKGRAVPEARLPPMIIGGFLFVIGLFWFGWTADPKYHWAIPVVATTFIGAGFNIIFQQCMNFLLDTYAVYAASAVSANTILRSLIASGLPLAARPMFLRMGVGPATSVLGGIACLALPVPFLFMKYGLRLRKLSKFAPVVED